MSNYWYLLPYAAMAALLALYLLVRFVMDVLDYRRSRRIHFTQTYGGCVYYGQHRPNFRTGQRL